MAGGGRIVQCDLAAFNRIARRVGGCGCACDAGGVQIIGERIGDRRIGHGPAQRGVGNVFVSQGRRAGGGVAVAGVAVICRSHGLAVVVGLRVCSKRLVAGRVFMGNGCGTGCADKCVFRARQFAVRGGNLGSCCHRVAQNSISVLKLGVVVAPCAAGVERLHIGAHTGVDIVAQVALADGSDLQNDQHGGHGIGAADCTGGGASEITVGGACTGDRRTDRCQILLADIVVLAVDIGAGMVAVTARCSSVAAFFQKCSVQFSVKILAETVFSPAGMFQQVNRCGRTVVGAGIIQRRRTQVVCV